MKPKHPKAILFAVILIGLLLIIDLFEVNRSPLFLDWSSIVFLCLSAYSCLFYFTKLLFIRDAKNIKGFLLFLFVTCLSAFIGYYFVLDNFGFKTEKDTVYVRFESDDIGGYHRIPEILVRLYDSTSKKDLYPNTSSDVGFFNDDPHVKALVDDYGFNYQQGQMFPGIYEVTLLKNSQQIIDAKRVSDANKDGGFNPVKKNQFTYMHLSTDRVVATSGIYSVVLRTQENTNENATSIDLLLEPDGEEGYVILASGEDIKPQIEKLLSHDDALALEAQLANLKK